MANSTIITDFLTQLKSYIGEDGRIPSEHQSTVTEIMGNITEITHVQMGIDAFGVPTVDGVSISDPNNLDIAVDEASQSAVLSNYFVGSDSEFGVLQGSDSVQTLITQIQAATTLDFTYTSEGTIHHLINSNFSIDIYEYDQTASPIQMADIVIRCGSLQNVAISIFGNENRSSNKTCLAYQLIKSNAGDMLMKGEVVTVGTEIDPEQGEELFENIGYGYYNIITSGDDTYVAHVSADYGGFLIAKMQYRGSGLSDHVDQDESWAFALMGVNNAPIFVGNFYTKGLDAIYCHNKDLTWTNTNYIVDDKVHLACVYAPSCGLVTSRNARWAVMTNQNGVFEMTYGGSTYRFDHGFCIKVI